MRPKLNGFERQPTGRFLRRSSSECVKISGTLKIAAGDCQRRFGTKMACKICNSENLQRLDGELTASLPSLKTLKVPPIYVCQSVVVCLECGFSELVIPTTELQSLKKAKAASGS